MTGLSFTASVRILKESVRRSPLAAPVRFLYRRLRPLSQGERNVRYDAQTVHVLARVLTSNSNCLDIGAHGGSILRIILRYAGQGHHVAFEPLPHLAAQLRLDFPKVRVCEVALSDVTGAATFEYVVSNPGYSGLRRRRYPRAEEEIRTIEVRATRLDDLIPGDRPIALAKNV